MPNPFSTEPDKKLFDNTIEEQAAMATNPAKLNNRRDSNLKQESWYQILAKLPFRERQRE